MTSESQNELEKIAQSYHLTSGEDMFIENLCQEHEWNWIKKGLESGNRVLDLGYGDGVIFSKLNELAVSRNLEIVLVEGAPSLVQKAQREFPKQEIILGYFEDIDFGYFDVIIASHVLEHVEDPVSLLKTLSRSLKEGGHLVAVLPNSESIHRRLAVQMGIQPELDSKSARDLVVGHRRVYSIETFLKDVSDSGLTCNEVKGFFAKPFPNSMLQSLGEEQIRWLLALGDIFPPEFGANLGFILAK